MSFIVSALPVEAFRTLFGRSEAELRARGVERRVADAAVGFPCRITLEDAPVGESLLPRPTAAATPSSSARAPAAPPASVAPCPRWCCAGVGSRCARSAAKVIFRPPRSHQAPRRSGPSSGCWLARASTTCTCITPPTAAIWRGSIGAEPPSPAAAASAAARQARHNRSQSTSSPRQ